MKRHLLLALLALPLTTVAGDGLWSRLAFRTDTAYIVRYPYRFTVRPGTGTTFGNLTTRWGAAEERHAHSILSAPVFKVGCNVSVYGLAVGIQRDVTQLLGTRETKDTEFSLSGFSPVIGGDIAYRSSNTHRLSGSTADGDSWRVPFTGSHIRRFLANGYVVCRPRRFSLPAAMTQRHRQVRSAGSPIVGATITGFTGTMQMQWMSHIPLYACDYYVHTRLFFGFRF